MTVAALWGQGAFAAESSRSTTASCVEPARVTLREVSAPAQGPSARIVVEYLPDRTGPLIVSLARHGIDAAVSAVGGERPLELQSPAPLDARDSFLVDAIAGKAVRLSLTPTVVNGPRASVVVRFEALAGRWEPDSPQLRALSALTGSYAAYLAQVRLENAAASDTLAALGREPSEASRSVTETKTADWPAVDTELKRALEALRPCASPGAEGQRLLAEISLSRASLATLKLEDWETAERLSRDAEVKAIGLGQTDLAVHARVFQASALIDGATAAKRSNDAARQNEATESFAKAVSLLQSARSFYSRQGRLADEAYIENYLGAADHYAGAWDSALKHYSAANTLYAKTPATFRRAVTVQNLALLASDRGDYREAAQLFERAKSLISGDPQPDMLATILENGGITLSAIGRQDEAIAHYASAAGIRRVQADQAGLARSMLGTGVALMRAGELREAEPFLEQAWTIRTRMQGRDRRGWFASGLTWAELQRVLGHRESAGKTLDLIEPAASSLAQKARLAVARAKVLEDEHEPAAALAQYDLVLGLELPATHPSVTVARIGRLRSLIELGQLDAVRRELDARREPMTPVIDSLAALDASFLVAELEARLGNRERALARVDQAIAVTRRIRSSSLSAESRAHFTASRRQQDELKICLFASCGETAGKAHASRTREDAITSLLASEAARSAGFAELLLGAPERRTRSAAADAKRGELLGEVESKLARIDVLSDRPVANAREIAALRRAMLETQMRLHKIETGALKEVPATVRDRATRTRLETLLARLPRNTAVLEFFLGRKSLLVWVLTRDSLSVHEIASGEKSVGALKHEISALLEGNADQKEYDERLASLARALIEPYVDAAVTKRVVIVPDGELFFVPFAALPVMPRGETAPRPLVERMEVVFSPSLSQLALSGGRVPEAKSAQTVAIVADPVFESDDPRAPAVLAATSLKPTGIDRLARLPGTIDEAQAVRSLFPDARIALLSGTSATRSSVMRVLGPGVTIAHFATHGVIRASDPSLSFLALSAYDDSWTPVPARLYNSDILSSGMRADLVVLSACRGAAGEVIAGEGPMGLGYSFLANGSGAVLATTAPVPDVFAAQFMRDFYAALVTDRSNPAGALRAAQLRAQQSTLWRSARYWGAFSLTTRQIEE